MNKFLFLVALTGGGCIGSLVRGPFIPMAIYYFYGVLRPQFLWRWQLFGFPEFGWSFYAAMAAILSYIPWTLGVVGPLNDPDRRVMPPFVVPHRLMLLFIVWLSLSYGFANNQFTAYPYWEEYLKIFAIYLLATQVIRSFWQIRILFMMVTLSLGYIAIDINHLYFGSGYLLLYKSGYAGLDNNGAGLMLAMGMPLCYFAWEITPKWYRWGFLILLVLLLHAVVSSYSRGAMLSSLLVTPLYYLYTRKRKFIIIVYLVMGAIVPVVAGKEIQERFFTVEKAEQDDSFNSRLGSWDAARRIANDYPIFGAGIRCSNLISHQYGADMEGRTIHSNYLQIAADNGWCGLLIFLGIIITTMLCIWRARIRLWSQQDFESRRRVAMLGGIEISIWTFLIGSMALSMETFELPYLMILLGAQSWALLNARILPGPGQRMGPPHNQVTVTVLPRNPQPDPMGTPSTAIPGAPLPPLPTRATVSGPGGARP